MINSQFGATIVKGFREEIEVDLTVIIESVYETFEEKYGEEEAKSVIEKCVDLALNHKDKTDKISDEEFEKTKERIKNLKKLIDGLLELAEEEDK